MLLSQKLFSTKSVRVKCCDFHPTQPWVLLSLFNGELQIWNYLTQTLVQTITISDKPVRCAKFIARQDWIVAVSDDQKVYVLDCKTSEHVTKFEAHSDFIRSVDVHPTLPLVLTSSDDQTVKLWDWEKGWACQVFSGHTLCDASCVLSSKPQHVCISIS